MVNCGCLPMQWLLGARSGSGVCFCAWEGRGGTWRMPFQSFSSFPLYIHPSTASETIFPVLLPDRSRLLFHTCAFSHPSVPLLLVAFIVIVVLSLGSPSPRPQNYLHHGGSGGFVSQGAKALHQCSHFDPSRSCWPGFHSSQA